MIHFYAIHQIFFLTLKLVELNHVGNSRQASSILRSELSSHGKAYRSVN